MPAEIDQLALDLMHRDPWKRPTLGQALRVVRGARDGLGVTRSGRVAASPRRFPWRWVARAAVLAGLVLLYRWWRSR